MKKFNLAILLCFLISLQPFHISPTCVKPPPLSFCSSVTYNTTVLDPVATDKVVFQYFNKNVVPNLPISSNECLDAYKSYVCAFYFPQCPYCLDSNGICREGCIYKTVACGSQVQDNINTCFGGNLFVEENYKYGCTPMSYNNSQPYQCKVPDWTYTSFCQPNYTVVTSINDYEEVWIAMDNVTSFKYNNYISSGGANDTCKQTMKELMCKMYFNPCSSDGTQYLNPRTEVLPPLCDQLVNNCPAKFSKLCSFNPYDPPIPPDTCT